MKELIICFFLVFLFSNCIAQIEEVKSSNDLSNIRLNNGYFMRIQPCSDKIIRIRVSANNLFNESLLERYEIVKNDFQKVEVQCSVNGNTVTLNTGFMILTIDKNMGTMSLKDKSGKVLVNNINLNLTDRKPEFGGFVQSLSKIFEKEIVSRAIIGADSTSITAQNVILKNKIALEKQHDLTDPVSPACIAEFSINPTECFYGLGSAIRDGIQHRGKIIRVWPQYQHSESPFPFTLSTNGWGVFFNTSRINYFDIGRYQSDRMMVYCSDETLDFYLMAGSMPEILDQYTTITQKPYLLPKWAYGLAFGSFWMENELNVLENAYHFREEKIPCDIYWLEYQWMEKNYDSSTHKDWNSTRFFNAGSYFWESSPAKRDIKPDLFINRMNNMGFKVALWLNNNEDLTIEEEDYLAAKQGKAQSGLDHWFPHLMKFVNQGVQGFKLDPGTTMDEHPARKYFNGLNDKEMHPVNQVLLPKQLYRLMRDSTGLRSFHHYCGGYSGIQHWAASTCGDNGGGRLALFDQLNLGISGVMNTSCDVLFLEKNEPIEQGLHFGFFLPWVQVNSWYGILHPWLLSPKQKKEFQFYAQLRYSLMPYIYSAALNGSLSGMPILRAMPLMYPNDLKVENSTSQFMFGDFLLVSAFTNRTYLPEGNWIDYWTGKKYQGNQEVVSEEQIHGGPLFIKAGAIIPYQKPIQYVDEHPVDTLIVRVFPEKQSSYTLLEDDGISFDYEKNAIAKTHFTCIAGDTQVEIGINCEGSYAGMPKNRCYEFEIATSKKPNMVMLNITPITNWIYSSDGKVKLMVSPGTLEQMTITLQLQ
jgi:alpha-glucosidase (family GH31 glycosyl hydrolase)